LVTAATTDKHAIFLFGDNAEGRVLETYAIYLKEVFSADELRNGTFTAVGAVHRTVEGDTKLPRSVNHYWPDYDPELTLTDPKPNSFVQYVAIGRKAAAVTGEAHHVVDRIAEAILRLARLSEPTNDTLHRHRKHRQVLRLLVGQPEARATYLDLVACLAVNREAMRR
jgi:hypothetical protein